MGGYWLCRRFRFARGAAGGSIAPDVPEVVEDILLCLVEVLWRRRSELALAGFGPVGPRAPVPVRASIIVFSVASIGRFPVIFCPLLAVASGGPMGRSNLKSLEADAMLLWRSSKLGEGKKSSDPAAFASGLYPPKEKREWLFRVEA